MNEDQPHLGWCLTGLAWLLFAALPSLAQEHDAPLPRLPESTEAIASPVAPALPSQPGKTPFLTEKAKAPATTQPVDPPKEGCSVKDGCPAKDKDKDKDKKDDPKKEDKKDDKKKDDCDCEENKPWWEKVPPIAPFPPLGYFPFPPTGPGYYSFADCVHGNYREKPPAWPYVRFGLIPPSFFNADFRYLENPNNTEHDYADCLKRIHIGDNWLFTTGGDFRYRFNNEADARLTETHQQYSLVRTRLYGDLWFQDIVRLYGEYLYADGFDIDLAPLPIDINQGEILNLFFDLKLGEIDKAPVYTRIGRQELLFGSERLISTLDWANTRRTFEGVSFFRYSEKFDATVFAVRPVPVDADDIDAADDDSFFTGVWLTWKPQKLHYIDAYYLNLNNDSSAFSGQNGVKGGINTNTVGARYFAQKDNFLWDLEGMFQFGRHVNQDILAKAYTAGFGYQFKKLPATPVLWFYYDYASGDPDPGASSTYRTFNQLFPFGHYYFGWIDVVGRQNINDFSLQLSAYPTPWIATFLQFHAFRLDSNKDALYNAAGLPIRQDKTGLAGNNVGNELDFIINFHLSNHSDLLMSYSHLFAGRFIRETGPDVSPDYFFLQYSYRW